MPETTQEPRLYDASVENILQADLMPQHISLLPGADPTPLAGRRLRLLWGQCMLCDLIDGRYRTVICGVNDQDNARGIIAKLINLIPTSQWSLPAVTDYAKLIHGSYAVHAPREQEPFVIKFDLDRLLVLAMLRPKGRDHFTVPDLARGFRTCVQMLQGRIDRTPVCTVSFLGAKSNQLVDSDGQEPSFETVLRVMYDSGFRGDVYPSPQMWDNGHVGVFPTYPFPESLQRMGAGSS